MNLRFISFVVMFGLIAGAGLAHGDKKHVIGTVEKINSDSVIIKTTSAKSVEVKLTATTVYTMRSKMVDKQAKLADLAVGDHVVIHATPVGDHLQADELKFSHAAESAASAPASNPRP